jgi:cation:H+ antiporter
MDEALKELLEGLPWPLLGLWIAVAVALLGKGADWLVNESVALSERSGIPKVVVGATVVSLGTTSPEAAVSVLSALRGNADLALGNAVGSVICDTGLILGLAALISPLRLDRRIVNRQGWIQLGAGVLLVAASWPWADPGSAFARGGNLPRWAGLGFLVLLGLYLWLSVVWFRRTGQPVVLEEYEKDVFKSPAFILLKLVGSLVLVVISARALIPAVEEAALRLDVPPGIVAASLVAFGTSLPELVTAITAARKGHGELAVGNVIGADILNVLFVAGAAAAVTGPGLDAGPHFFRLLFPGMLLVLLVFRLGVLLSGTHLRRGFGLLLVALYVGILTASYLLPGVRWPTP